MKNLISDLWPAVLLILVASAVLLLSDQGRSKRNEENTALQDKFQAADDSQRNNRIIDFEKEPRPTVDELLQAERFLNLYAKNGRPASLVLINLVENPMLEWAVSGVEAALDESGLINGKDYLIKKYSAQGEIGQLPQIIDAAILEKPDALITVTTPAFIAAARKNHDIPLIFTVASDPYKLKVFRDKRPDHICGVHDNPPVDKLLEMASRYDRDLKKVGIIYDAAQINSLISVEKLRVAGKEQHIQVLESTASTVSDLIAGAQALIQRGAEAFIFSADNLVYTGFPAIVKVAQSANIPIYVTETELINQGATGGIGNNLYEWGKQSGFMAVKVLAGVPPSRLPVEETKTQEIIEPVVGSY
jgi:putative ABC transport system substrate-binding protein